MELKRDAVWMVDDKIVGRVEDGRYRACRTPAPLVAGNVHWYGQYTDSCPECKDIWHLREAAGIVNEIENSHIIPDRLGEPVDGSYPLTIEDVLS